MLGDTECKELTPILAVLLLNGDASSSNSGSRFPKFICNPQCINCAGLRLVQKLSAQRQYLQIKFLFC